MKKIALYTMSWLVSFSCFLQSVKHGVIERNKEGTIASVTFSGEEKNKAPRSSQEFITRYLEAAQDNHFEKVPHKSKKRNFVHEHYDQYYKGVRVEGAGYNFHFKDGQMYFANGHYVEVKDINATPSITPEKAVNSFLNYKRIERSHVANSMTELLVKELRGQGNDVASVVLVYRIYLEADGQNVLNII